MKKRTNQQIGRGSKIKGSNGELEVAALFKKNGYAARRSSQFCGSSGDAQDVMVLDVPELHVEVKRTERLNLYEAMEQVERDNIKKRQIPVIFHRRNHQDWVCIVSQETFFKLLKGYKMAQEFLEDDGLTDAERSQLAYVGDSPERKAKMEKIKAQIEAQAATASQPIVLEEVVQEEVVQEEVVQEEVPVVDEVH